MSILGGVPSYFAMLVDSTNSATTNWTAYTSSNITANLGASEGWHEVRVGLRGLPPDAQQTWAWIRLKLDHTAPQLIITNPTNGTVTVPLLQLTGYSPEPLSGLTYGISNAAGTATGLQAVITGQIYSTNTSEFTTNFQCYQPMVAVWAEADLVLADEFRDGNVPARQEPLTCAKLAFATLPASITQRYFRGDSACHEKGLLDWLKHPDREKEPGGGIGFAVSAFMSPPLAQALRKISDTCRWQ